MIRRNHARGFDLMGIFDRFRKPEARNLENPRAPVSAEDFLQVMGWGGGMSESGINVTIDNALGVPAIWAAVNFISGTLAGLPLHVYRKTREGRQRIETGPLAGILHDVANDEMSSFEWRKYLFDQVLTGGRCVSYIERSQNGNIVNIWPLDPHHTRVDHVLDDRKLVKVYTYKGIKYQASEVIDISFMLKANQLDIRGPIMTNKDAIGLAIAATKYGSKAFQSGGIPPMTLQGPFQSGAAAQRASTDVANTTMKLAREGKPVMAIPMGHELKPVGFNPTEMQLLELQRFSIEQIARIYSLPPIFLQDLSKGTYSNTEQQDLHFVKHTLKRWIEQFEQELNLKLFPRGSRQYVEFNVDGLLRGDFKTRMEAHATTIQNGIRTPNEVREIENMMPMPEGDSLMIQGATVPIAAQVGGFTDANTD
jgi:HK97 family phage portal protein